MACSAPPALGQPGQATNPGKLVGVVFDNSGSMAGRTNLPVYGIQVLAASLTADDELYGLTFKDFLTKLGNRTTINLDAKALEALFTKLSLATEREQQDTITKIRTWAKGPDHGTPLVAVQAMVAFLAQKAQTGQDVHVFIFTDGEFNKPFPDLNELQQEFNRYRTLAIDTNKAKSLQAHFIAFGDAKTHDAIRQQGIAATLTQIFPRQIRGTSKGDEPIYVDSFDRLREALIEAIASISETELPMSGAQISRQVGKQFVVKPPFTVTKLIVVATAPNRTAIPQITKTPDYVGNVKTDYQAYMEAQDDPSKALGGAGQRWQATVTHMRPHPALPADQEFAIAFDRELTQDTTLLFRTDITVEWKIVDAQGVDIDPDPTTGVLTLAAERDYAVYAWIEDKHLPSGSISLANLPSSPLFTFLRTALGASAAPSSTQMRIDPKAGHRVTAPLRYNAPQSEEARVALRMPGFVTARSKQLKINVVKSSIDVNIKKTPLCPGCRETRAEVKLASTLDYQPIMRVTTSFTSKGQAKTGRVSFALQKPLPPGLRVVAPHLGGAVLMEDSKITADMSFQDGIPIDVIFEANVGFLQSLGKDYDVAFKANTLGLATGYANAQFSIVGLPEDATIVPAGTTTGAPGATPFVVKAVDLCGDGGIYVRVNKAHVPPEASNLRVDAPAGLKVIVAQQPQKDLYLLKFQASFLCGCFVRTGRHDFTVWFNNSMHQSAHLNHFMIIEPVTYLERFRSCLWLILGMLLTLWFILGMYRFLQSHRFPRNSRLGMYEARKREEAEWKRLAKRPGPWIKPFLWPLKRWDERSRLYGLWLEAGPDCVRILPKSGGYTNIRRAGEHHPLSYHFAEGTKEPLDLFWGDRLEEIGAGRQIYEFVETLADTS